MELNYWQSMASRERSEAGDAGLSDNINTETAGIRLTKPEMVRKDVSGSKAVINNSRFEDIPSFDAKPSAQGRPSVSYEREVSYEQEPRPYEYNAYSDPRDSREQSAEPEYEQYDDNDAYNGNYDGHYDEGQYDNGHYDDRYDDRYEDRYEDNEEYEDTEENEEGYEDIPNVNIPDSVFDMKTSATPPDIDYTDDDFLSVSEEPVHQPAPSFEEQEKPQSLKFNVSYDEVPEVEPDDDKRLSIKRLKVDAGIKVKDESRPFTVKGLFLFLFIGIPICIPLFLVGLGVLAAATAAAFVIAVASAILTLLLAVLGVGAIVLGGIYVSSLTPFALTSFGVGAGALCFSILFILVTTLMAAKVFPKLLSVIGKYCYKCYDRVR